MGSTKRIFQPYVLRMLIRERLPYPICRFLLRFGLFAKGRDCEARGGSHEWYNEDHVNSRCYLCEVKRPGRLWENQESSDDA